MKDRRLFPRAVLMAFCGETSNSKSSLHLDNFPALLVLYVPMAAVGYFELGEMARCVQLSCKYENLFNENPGRQDGGIVCALCDGGVKLMVEVILTNRDNLQNKYLLPQILLLVHLISAYPMFLNPPNQFLEKMIGLPPSEFENP